MRHNPFESQLERLARTLTDQFGVNVLCQGEEAWTDGKQIVLPSLPEPLDEDLEKMVLGFLDHEMAHVAFSDFNVVKEFSQKHPGYEAMLNVVEDALIERRAMERWPGVRGNLDSMFRQIRDRIAKLVGQRDPFGKFCTAVYLKLSHHNDMLGLEHEVAKYDDLFDWFPAVCDTRGAAKLAEQILERWLSQKRCESPACDAETSPDVTKFQPDEQGDNGSNQSGDHRDRQRNDGQEPNSGEETGGAEQQRAEKADGDDTGVDRQAASSDETGHDGHKEASDSSGKRNDEGQGPEVPAIQPSEAERGTNVPKPESESVARHNPIGAGGEVQGGSLITEALTEAISECAANTAASSEYRVYTKRHDSIEVTPTASEHEVRALLEGHTDTIRRLRRGLANALRSAEKRWWREDQMRGALSPRNMHRLCIDRSRLDIFRARAMVQGRSTAVSIVLDASGSMTSRKMEVARDALRVLLEALADLKVATEALTFTTGNEFSITHAAQLAGEDPNQIRSRYSRFANLEIGLVKQFGEPLKSALRRLPSIHGSGLTPLGEAMHVGSRRLMSRPETRRIMLVLTDGRAGCEARGDTAVRHAEDVARKTEKAGTELIGVGIMDDSLRAIVADIIVVHQLEDLPAQLCKLLGRTLLKGLRNVG